MKVLDELLDEQVCPYCEHVVEDCQSNWDEDEEEVTCNRCNKKYTVRAVYQFKGFQIEKQCEQCGEWTDEGMMLCDCEEVGNSERDNFCLGDVVKHRDAAFSENFTITEVGADDSDYDYLIQGPKPKYNEPFPVSSEKLIKV